MEPGLVSEIEELNARLSQTKEKLIDSWMKNQFSALKTESKKRHQLSLKEAQEELESYQNSIKKIHHLAACNNRELESREKALQELKQDLQIITCQTDSALQTQESLEVQKENMAEEIAKKKNLLEHQAKATEKQLSDIEKASSFFTERLALNIIKCSGNRLQFVFSCINPSDPEAICYFFLRIEGDERKYRVFDCEPPVPDLDALVEKLNETNNLKSFVVVMRKRFKEIECRKTQSNSAAK